jgi:hypothetical protein
MMTLEDVVDLVLYACEHGRNGDIFVQKSPNLKGSTKYERRSTKYRAPQRHPSLRTSYLVLRTFFTSANHQNAIIMLDKHYLCQA